LLCGLGGHEASDKATYNSGYYFSACRRCGTDMVRCGASWREVPDGHKVVWKSGRHAHSVEPDYGSVLPVVHTGAAPPIVTPTVGRRIRQVPVAVAAARRTNTAVAPSGELNDYPVLIALAAMVGAALQLALGLRDFRGF